MCARSAELLARTPGAEDCTMRVRCTMRCNIARVATRCALAYAMHLVGTHERSALAEASRLGAEAAAAAPDATRVEGGPRRARGPTRRDRRAWRDGRGGGALPLERQGVHPGCCASALAHDLLELGQVNPACEIARQRVTLSKARCASGLAWSLWYTAAAYACRMWGGAAGGGARHPRSHRRRPSFP